MLTVDYGLKNKNKTKNDNGPERNAIVNYPEQPSES
jgi:hypothetical protein